MSTNGVDHTPMSRRELAACALLTALAFALRLPGLNNGLWLDEYYAFYDSFRAPLGAVFTRFPGDNHHPLYAVLANLSIRLFGDSPASARVPAFVFGAASVPLLLVLARRITSRTESWLAAGLLCASYHHVWFSQNARGYTMLAFFAILATYLLVRAFETSTTGLWVAYAITAALGAYTHLTMVFIVVAHAVVGAIVLVQRRGRGAQAMILAFVGSGVLTTLLYAPMLGQVLAYFTQPTDMVGVSSPMWAILEAGRVLRAGLGGGRGPLFAAVALVALAIGGSVVLLGARSYLRQELSTGLALMLPAFALVAGALLARGTMYPRFFFSLAGPALLILIRGSVRALRWPPWSNSAAPAPVGVAFIGLLIAGSLVSLPANYRLPKQDFEGALRYLDENAAPGDQVVAPGGPTVRPLLQYFGRQFIYTSDAAEIERVRARGTTWLVYTFPRYLEIGAADVAALIRRECTAPRAFPGTVSGGEVFVCRLPAVPAPR